jgi:hypothetical protein
VIAALFQPLRLRIQAIIDRRFYRRQYDTQQAIDAFRLALRAEVDLEQLHEHLLAVVEETMQPASLSVDPPFQAAGISGRDQGRSSSAC